MNGTDAGGGRLHSLGSAVPGFTVLCLWHGWHFRGGQGEETTAPGMQGLCVWTGLPQLEASGQRSSHGGHEGSPGRGGLICCL